MNKCVQIAAHPVTITCCLLLRLVLVVNTPHDILDTPS